MYVSNFTVEYPPSIDTFRTTVQLVASRDLQSHETSQFSHTLREGLQFFTISEVQCLETPQVTHAVGECLQVLATPEIELGEAGEPAEGVRQRRPAASPTS